MNDTTDKATQQAAPAEPSPTAGMNIAQRILHVGGRNNPAGYVEFGSIQAVEALVRHVLRDLPDPKPQQVVQGVPVGWLYDWVSAEGEVVRDWFSTDYDEAHKHAHNTRPLYTSPQPAPKPHPEPDIEVAAKTLAECMDYPWEHMPEKGRAEMLKHARAIINAAHGIKGGQP